MVTWNKSLYNEKCNTGTKRACCLYVCLFFFLFAKCLLSSSLFHKRIRDFFSLNYTAVSVWENDCSGIVIRVLAPDPAAPVSEVTWTEAWLEATENLLPLSEACFWSTLWMLGLLDACWSCWLSIPCRNAFTTRICKHRNKKDVISINEVNLLDEMAFYSAHRNIEGQQMHHHLAIPCWRLQEEVACLDLKTCASKPSTQVTQQHGGDNKTLIIEGSSCQTISD